jgi:hypothetical protein
MKKITTARRFMYEQSLHRTKQALKSIKGDRDKGVEKKALKTIIREYENILGYYGGQNESSKAVQTASA